jgi:hypothetical protein
LVSSTEPYLPVFLSDSEINDSSLCTEDSGMTDLLLDYLFLIGPLADPYFAEAASFILYSVIIST